MERGMSIGRRVTGREDLGVGARVPRRGGRHAAPGWAAVVLLGLAACGDEEGAVRDSDAGGPALAARAGSLLSGRVVDARGAGLPAIEVVWCAPPSVAGSREDATSPSTRSVMTDDSGGFAFPRPERGGGEGAAEPDWAGGLLFARALQAGRWQAEAVLARPGRGDHAIRLVRGHAIQGQARLPAGVWGPDLWVEARGFARRADPEEPGSEAVPVRARLDREGGYRLEGVPPSPNLEVAVRRHPTLPVLAATPVRATAEGEADATAPLRAPILDLTGRASLRGVTVHDADGKPRRGARVQLRAAGGGVLIGEVSTDRSGRAEFTVGSAPLEVTVLSRNGGLVRASLETLEDRPLVPADPLPFSVRVLGDDRGRPGPPYVWVGFERVHPDGRPISEAGAELPVAFGEAALVLGDTLKFKVPEPASVRVFTYLHPDRERFG